MKTVKVLTKDGEQQWELKAENNGLGVTRDPRDVYTVTHLNTGLAVGLYGFNKEANAKGYMDAIAALHPWKELTDKFTKDEVAGLYKKVRANWELWQLNEDETDVGVQP